MKYSAAEIAPACSGDNCEERMLHLCMYRLPIFLVQLYRIRVNVFRDPEVTGKYRADRAGSHEGHVTTTPEANP